MNLLGEERCFEIDARQYHPSEVINLTKLCPKEFSTW